MLKSGTGRTCEWLLKVAVHKVRLYLCSVGKAAQIDETKINVNPVLGLRILFLSCTFSFIQHIGVSLFAFNFHCCREKLCKNVVSFFSPAVFFFLPLMT